MARGSPTAFASEVQDAVDAATSLGDGGRVLELLAPRQCAFVARGLREGV